MQFNSSTEKEPVTNHLIVQPDIEQLSLANNSGLTVFAYIEYHRNSIIQLMKTYISQTSKQNILQEFQVIKKSMSPPKLCYLNLILFLPNLSI